MKIIMWLIIIILAMTTPGPAHAQGFFKYVLDAVANQLGLDRGPIPKVMPKSRPHQWDKYGNRIPPHVYLPEFHLQAEGF